jgi:hypothetical protein
LPAKAVVEPLGDGNPASRWNPGDGGKRAMASGSDGQPRGRQRI